MTEKDFPVEEVQLTSIEHLDLFEHLDREVAVLVDDQGLPWGPHLRVCLSQQSLEEQLQRFNCRAGTYPFGIIIDFLLKNKHESLILYGFAVGNYALDYAELEKITYEIDTFCALLSCSKDKLTPEDTFDIIKNRTFYYLGSPILTEVNSTFNFEIETKDDQHFVKLFISKESAKKQNYRQQEAIPVNLAQFRLFVQGKYGIVIEPNRHYTVRYD